MEKNAKERMALHNERTSKQKVALMVEPSFQKSPKLTGNVRVDAKEDNLAHQFDALACPTSDIALPA